MLKKVRSDGIFFSVRPPLGLLPVLGPLERYMTPTLDAALLYFSRVGADLGQLCAYFTCNFILTLNIDNSQSKSDVRKVQNSAWAGTGRLFCFFYLTVKFKFLFTCELSSFALKTSLDMGQLFFIYNNTKIYPAVVAWR